MEEADSPMAFRLHGSLLLLPVGGLVSELDPDAPSRQGKVLQTDNARAEERLMARLWQLVRAGEFKWVMRGTMRHSTLLLAVGSELACIT